MLHKNKKKSERVKEKQNYQYGEARETVTTRFYRGDVHFFITCFGKN